MRRYLPLLALVAVLPLTACGRSHGLAPASSAGHAADADLTDPGLVTPGFFAPDPADEPSPEPIAVDPPEDPDQTALEDSWRGPEPRGTVAQISLRFLQALQRGDDLAADRELAKRVRFTLSMGDLWQLHRVMSDVRKNAGLADAGPCRHAAQLSREAAVVTCGRRHVVVNAGTLASPNGVRIDDWTAHYDVFHGPHTHAYTLMVL